MAYFDDLLPDYTVEIPPSSNESLETMRRLLFMFKLSMNGHMVLLSDDDLNVLAISPEFESQFDWTLEEFQELDPSEFFHADRNSAWSPVTVENVNAPVNVTTPSIIDVTAGRSPVATTVGVSTSS